MENEQDFSQVTRPIGDIGWKSWREQDVGTFLYGPPYFLVTIQGERNYLWALDTERENIAEYRYKFLEEGKFSDLVDKGNALMEQLPPLPKIGLNIEDLKRSLLSDDDLK